MANLSYSTQLIEQDDIESVIEVLKSDFLAQGPNVEKFEKTLCEYTGAKYAVTFNSATSALSAAYNVAGIQEGDEVITSPISFVATSNMFVDIGAIPAWCDVTEDGNIDAKKIENLITPKTKAIVPIHFSGKPVEIDKIHTIAKKHNLLVIEDCAHALGSSIDGKKIGSFSDMSIFSFHAIKPITTGEGGAILTDNEEYATKLRRFRSHGIIKKEHWDSDMMEMGYNYRMTEVAAALGLSQLKKLDKFIALRNEIAHYYDARFSQQNHFTFSKINPDLLSSRHLYPILLNSSLLASKEKIFTALREKDLGVQVHYKPIYQNSFYIEKFGDITLDGADTFYDAEISIPCHHNMSLHDAKYVADTLLDLLDSINKDG